MNVFVWNRIDTVSNSYHSEGGLVVFAADGQRARALANEHEGVALKPEEAPDHVRVCGPGAELVIVMPDAGCC